MQAKATLRKNYEETQSQKKKSSMRCLADHEIPVHKTKSKRKNPHSSTASVRSTPAKGMPVSMFNTLLQTHTSGSCAPTPVSVPHSLPVSAVCGYKSP